MANKPLEQIIDALNSALEADPEAVRTLIATRIPCNAKLADHPMIVCGDEDGKLTVGPLGFLNGALEAAGLGRIAAQIEPLPVEESDIDRPRVVKFIPYNRENFIKHPSTPA